MEANDGNGHATVSFGIIPKPVGHPPVPLPVQDPPTAHHIGALIVKTEVFESVAILFITFILPKA